MKLLQQQVMFKQMQEMQRQQQFQSFTDSRQHPVILKNSDGAQYCPVINGTPVHSNSNMFTNWGQLCGSPSFQGMSQLVSAQDHRSAYGGDGVQQYDGSSYGSPIPSAGGGINQVYLQGISSGSPMQQQQQQLDCNHSFAGGQNFDSSYQAFSSRQDYSSNFHGQVHEKGNEDSTSGSFKHASVLPKNAMTYMINEKERSGWPSNQLINNAMHISPSQGSATLDPLEEKILFSMDDNLWDMSSGKGTEAGAGNTGSALGSWSALMQSALGETSSSETGLQEERSGLTFQNTDPSADNQTSNFVESGHRQSECVENSTQPSSALSVTEYQYLNNPGMNFPGFHQAVTDNQSEQDRSLRSSHEQIHTFPQTCGRFVGSVHSILTSQELKTSAASEAQYNNQSALQDSSLQPSPSQRYLNHNIMQASKNSCQKNGTPVISSSVPNQSQLQWQQISRSAVRSQPIQTALYSAATRYANSIASLQQNSPGSTNANPFVQQDAVLGAHSTSQLSGASNLSQQDVFSSKPINQWTDVPIQKQFVDTKSELFQGSASSDKHVDDMIGYPQILNEQETENVMPGRSSAKPVRKYEEEKFQSHILSEVKPDSVIQPTSERRELVEKQSEHLEKKSSMNQMDILYSHQEDTVCSTNAVAATRPYKRKSRTSELLPWHKEVATISAIFPNTRIGEQDWAQATNQLVEEASEAELLKFNKDIILPRKRLILTTKLMQTFLRPAPRTILSMDADSAYESFAYVVARLSLGDACIMSHALAKTDLANKSDKEENINLDEVLENFSKRIKQLEDVLQRSEEIPSIVDTRVEYMDLEGFSVINRFAKFHSRPQQNPPDPFSSGPPKMYPQRYVSAFPMPKEIPDGLHCISL